jgi:alpha-D-ribose 1-methylphosphonate 5-triphosphate synthase subunit PhnG
MRGSAQSTPPPWIESDSFRETTLQLFDDPDDRAAVRRLGQVLYDLAVAASRELGGESSVTRAELRAIAADLRHTGGYCAMVGRSAEECSLAATDDALAHFAGKLAGRLGKLVEKIEERLS